VFITDGGRWQAMSIVRSFALPTLGPLFQTIADSSPLGDSTSTSEHFGTLFVVFGVNDLDFLLLIVQPARTTRRVNQIQ
jgi:hypothetical protein